MKRIAGEGRGGGCSSMRAACATCESFCRPRRQHARSFTPSFGLFLIRRKQRTAPRSLRVSRS